MLPLGVDADVSHAIVRGLRRRVPEIDLASFPNSCLGTHTSKLRFLSRTGLEFMPRPTLAIPVPAIMLGRPDWSRRSLASGEFAGVPRKRNRGAKRSFGQCSQTEFGNEKKMFQPIARSALFLIRQRA
jgi:hypothetical protein